MNYIKECLKQLNWLDWLFITILATIVVLLKY